MAPKRSSSVVPGPVWDDLHTIIQKIYSNYTLKVVNIQVRILVQKPGADDFRWEWEMHASTEECLTLLPVELADRAIMETTKGSGAYYIERQSVKP